MSSSRKSNPVAVVDGALVVDKPAGPTSHDVVATTRRALGFDRIGHTGTLDPHASGVLTLVLGRATRLAQFLSVAEKEYEATIRFGIETDTYDLSGRTVRETGAVPSREALEAALARFRGSFTQTPPAFSAKMVAGARAYTLARRAATVDLEAVPVVTRDLEVLTFNGTSACLRLVCSAGFYVRSLAHDLGQVLRTGACLEGLVRTRSGTFWLADAIPFATVAAGDRAAVATHVVPPERVLAEWPAVSLTPGGARRTLHGQDIRPEDVVDGRLPRAGFTRLLAPDGQMLGVAEPTKTPGFLHPVVVLGVK